MYTLNKLLSLNLNVYKFGKSTSNILLSLTVNTEILKVYFKFTSELEKRYKCTSKTDTKYT